MREIDEAFELFDKGEFQQAEKLYLTYLMKLTDKTSAPYKAILNGLGYVKSFQGQYREAKDYYQKLLEISKRQFDTKEEAIALHQLGMVERMAGDYKKAKDYFSAEHEIWIREYPDFYVGFSANFYERGFIAARLKKYQEALSLLNHALEYAFLAKDLIAQGCAYRELGELAASRSQIEQAKSHFQSAFSAFQEAKDEKAVEEIQHLLDRYGNAVSKDKEI